MSLESPQLEDGFTPVANTIMEPICHTRLSGTDWAFLHFLWRKTYGWSKPSDIISLSQFCEGTGLSQAHVCRTIKRLLSMNVIFRHVARIGNGDTATYEFNKRVWSWKSLPKLATLPKLAIQPLPALAHTTERSTTTEKRLSPITPKIGKRKKAGLTPEESEVLAYLNLKADNSFTAPGEIGKRIAEGHTVEECKIIIDKKVAEWGKTEFAKNLNPTTLFRLCHFDTYLHQKSEISSKKFDLNAIGKSNMGEEWG